ncbi:hypothetical protein NQ315_000160 [Exocentrus adspersus]|uniref:Cytochrome P450 n=1 Tax=Exocentrus adspersus TaxID=1586481 RepID=A0AAV8VQ62_9CUCU|nr:hypothetical protein NQ315_000160 [Exocentrus adspersus]
MIWTSQNLTLLLCTLILTLWYLSFLWKRRKLYYLSWNAPGPLSLPLIGAAYIFFGKPNDILDKIYTIIPLYPDLTKLWFGYRLIYCLTEPEHIEKVLTNAKCLGKDHLYRFLVYSIGSGLLTAPTQKWRKHRKAIMPSFNQKVLDSFVDVFAEQASVFNEIIKKHSGKKNLQLDFSALTLDIICETAMGLKMNIQRGEQYAFAVDLEMIMEVTTLRIFRVWHHLEWTWRLYPMSRLLDKHLAGFRSVTSTVSWRGYGLKRVEHQERRRDANSDVLFPSKVIRKKMEAFEDEKKHKENFLITQVEQCETKRRLAFLDLVLQNSSFTEEELLEEVEIFLIAGTDTSATTLFFLFAMFGLFPDVQQKVYEEVMEILGEDRQVEPSDLPKFKYTERVIKETLRLFPVGVYFVRLAEEDVDLGRYVLPEGAAAFFSVLNIHRNPKYWPDPLRFDPDRFLPEEVAKRHPCTYIPFSYGPRNCIGSRYAMMSLKTITATILRKYRALTHYKSVEEVELMTKIVLRPKDGSKVYLELR